MYESARDMYRSVVHSCKTIEDWKASYRWAANMAIKADLLAKTYKEVLESSLPEELNKKVTKAVLEIFRDNMTLHGPKWLRELHGLEAPAENRFLDFEDVGLPEDWDGGDDDWDDEDETEEGVNEYVDD